MVDLPSYLAFAPGFILPCAQRCFSSRDSFLRAARLIRRAGFNALVTPVYNN